MPSGPDVTDLLARYRDGDRAALDALFPIVLKELRLVARREMRRERTGHTLQTTALVNEAYLRLVDVDRMQWQDRAHFLAFASRAMRRVLVDHARRIHARKRGGGIRPESLDDATIAVDAQAETLVELEPALERLTQLNPRLTQVVECRFFGGMTESEIALALGITERTVRRDWVKARAWLRQELRPA